MVETGKLAEKIGVSAACDALHVPRSSFYRQQKGEGKEEKEEKVRVKSARALSEKEVENVRQVLYSKRFCDMSPREVWATLLDEGIYLCSWRTMYRILEEKGENGERRRGHHKSHYKKPELLATGPNQVWSWDITKLKSPITWNYFYLYVIIDIYSRCVVGWMIAESENSVLAKELIEETCIRQNIAPDQLTLHSDRGSSMKSKTVAQLLVSLGVLKSHSRPHVSDDNPFSEAQFKTLKYHPAFPERFGSIQDARAFCIEFFEWYNHQHHHSGISLLTPYDLHSGRAQEVIEKRKKVVKTAFKAHPERFVRGIPRIDEVPEAVWINPPPALKREEAVKGHHSER